MTNTPLPAPQAPTQVVKPPYIAIQVVADGNIQCQTNIKDRVLLMGLIEVGKQSLIEGMKKAAAPSIVKPGGLNGLMRRMRP